MSDLMLNILTQDNKQFVSTDSKDQKTSRMMKEMYDFEKLLLDDIDNEDESFKENDLTSGDTDAVLTQNNEENAHNNITLSSNVFNNLKESYSSNVYTSITDDKSYLNKLKLFVESLIKSEQTTYTENLTKEPRKLSKLRLINNLLVDKVYQSDKKTDLESIRLVKTDKGLYLDCIAD